MYNTASCMLVPTAYSWSGYWKWFVDLFCCYVTGIASYST